MLEILILMTLGRNIANKAREKGRSGGGYVALLLLFWFGGELAGAIIAGVAAMATDGGTEPPMLICYLGALAGAVVGAVIAFAIVGSLAPVRKYDDYEDEDEYEDHDRPGRKHEREREEDRY